jgi:hypothetical protein
MMAFGQLVYHRCNGNARNATPSMASQHRKHRGYRTQALVAQWLKQWYPAAESTGAGRQGEDITGVPFSIECKARSDFQPLAWIKQAESNKNGKIAFVVSRCNTQGEDASQYLAFMRLGDLMNILQDRAPNNEPTRCQQCGSWMIENAICHTCQQGGISLA